MVGAAKGRRARGRFAGLLATCALVAGLVPGTAPANHATCSPSSDPPCGPFTPAYEAGPQHVFTDVPSAITYRVYQDDHERPAVDVTYLVPKGWEFAAEGVRPGEKPGGAPATQCSDVFDGVGNYLDNQPAHLKRAESLTGSGVGMTLAFDGSRTATPRNQGNVQPVRYGFGREAESTVAYLRWNAGSQTADLCFYLYTFDTRVDHGANPNDPCNVPGRTVFNVPPPQDPNCEKSREHMIPVTLQRIPASDPLSATFGWRIHYDFASVYRDENLFGQSASILSSLFYLSELSVGNWNRNEVTGKLERVVFSRTPSAPDTYEFRADLATCADGFNPMPNGAMCKNDTLETLSLSTFVPISLPPSPNIHDFARLTGPAGPTGMPAGFGLLRNTTSLPISWQQPAANPGEPIKGYAIVVAVPGVQDTRHFEYVVTNPADAGFDARQACGADGSSPTCSVTLNLPLSGSPTTLAGDDKYSIALVTVYRDGHRTDKRCDDGTGAGAACPPAKKNFNVVAPGISTWEVLTMPDVWPDAFVETAVIPRTGGGQSFRGPTYVLLVDYILKRAAFIRWNADQRAEFFRATSNTIVGSAGTGALSFSSSTLLGPAAAWVFEGVTTVLPVIDPSLTLQARGLFLKLDLRGLPQNPPSGPPSLLVETFEGIRL